MPSVVLGQPVASGSQLIVSGNFWSGTPEPIGGIQLRYIMTLSSGGGTSGLNCYIGLSGGGPVLSGSFMTITSGGMQLSGGPASGMLDGFPLTPGDTYWIPKARLYPVSGNYNVFALHDAAVSGIGRIYFDVF